MITSYYRTITQPLKREMPGYGNPGMGGLTVPSRVHGVKYIGSTFIFLFWPSKYLGVWYIEHCCMS